MWEAVARAGTGIGAAMRLSLATVLLLTAIARYGAPPAYAADPQPYRVDMGSTGDQALDATLKATSDLLTLRSSAPVGPFGLIGRARGDLGRLKTVLESFGYYQSYVAITIDGLPLDDATLGEELNSRAAGNDARVRITFSIGPLYHLGRIDIDGEVPKSAAGALGLTTGVPAVASDVLAGGDRLQTALQDQGYAFAKVDPPLAYEDPPNRVLNVSFHVVTGSRVQIGEIRIQGLTRTHEPFVRKRLLVHTGEQYSAGKIEQARKDLLGLGVFSAVSVQIGTAADTSGRVPITFTIRERLLHSVSVSGAYSSDLGGSAGVTWSNRNVSGNAEQLTLAASVINLGGSATTGLGYDTSAKYLVPEFGHRDQSLQLAVGALKQSLQAYNQTAFTTGVTVNRKLSSIWSASAGFSAEQERIQQEGVTTNYTLLAIPINVLYNSTGLDSPLQDPRHGMRASLSVAPTLSVAHPNSRFLITQGNVALYFDLQGLGLSRDPGRRILALRALAGLAAGAGQLSLPPDQRFYAGGSGTIRGYRYQSVGPQFPDGFPIGGTAINAGSAEFRQRIGTNFGMAVFVDAGQVSANLNPLAGTLRFGTGAGVRYYTPIGPIRVDIALPIERRANDDAFEIYIGLGQAF
jgi:translocation and assembly module TamA